MTTLITEPGVKTDDKSNVIHIRITDEVLSALRAGYNLAALLRAHEDNLNEPLSDDDNAVREEWENDIEGALRAIDPGYLKNDDDTDEGDQ